jgi:hypothetical protein
MRTIPFESLMMSIVVEQQKTIRRLEEELQKLKP